MTTFTLDGRTALVTGARDGIGRAAAVALAEAGADLVLWGHRDDLDSAAAEVAGYGRKVKTVAADLSDAAAQVLIDRFEQCPSHMTACVLESMGGAASRVASTATAYPHREPGHNLLILSQWADPADTEPNIAWTRETFEALQPHMADRRYVNYLSADDAGYTRDAYGSNYDRLVELKRRYDPDNIFHLNQNIDPS